MSKITRSALVSHGAHKMYALVEDIESYPEFLPWCRESRVLERTEGRTVATLSVGFKGISQTFTTENLNSPGESIELSLIEGPFSRFSADWRFRSLGDDAVRIEFSIAYVFSSRVLGRVLEPLFDHIANTMVDAFIQRAEVVYGPAEN